MRIVVKKRFPIVIGIPNRLFCGRFGAFCIAEGLKSEGIAVDRAQLAAVLRTCRELLRAYRGLTIVEVDAADGTHVKLSL